MAPPLVDVVVPVYNGAATVESALRSLQAQTVEAMRIVVVDDGSTDATPDILKRLAAADSRLRVVSQENKGLVDALNAGLAMCRAEFIARHDADDLALPGRFAAQLGYLREHLDCVAVSGAIRHIDESGQPRSGPIRLPSPDLADFNWYPQREPYLSHPFLMMRRFAAEQAGGYRYAFHAEDTDLYWRLQELGRLVNLDDLLGDYRVHAKSVMGESPVNGRISAVNSQRAGLSAKRRRAGQTDIAWRKSALAEYKAASSLAGMVAVGSHDLDRDEAQRLAVAACAKLLDLAGYRSFELDLDDCDYIRRVLVPALPHMEPDNRDFCTRMLSGTAARLAQRGEVASALRLVPKRLYPSVAARLALRVAAPQSVRHAMRRAVGRSVIMK